MIKLEGIICFVFTLLFSVISLATTCSPADDNCSLNQKKMQLMDNMGIKPTATKSQIAKDDDKKPSEPVSFQIPRPENPLAKAARDQSNQAQQPKLYPWSTISNRPIQGFQEPKLISQQPKAETEAEKETGTVTGAGTEIETQPQSQPVLLTPPTVQPQTGVKYR